MLKALLHCFAISSVASEKKVRCLWFPFLCVCDTWRFWRGMVGSFSVRKCSSLPFMSGLAELLHMPWCVHWPSVCSFLLLHEKSGNFSCDSSGLGFFLFCFVYIHLIIQCWTSSLSLHFSLFCPIYILGYFFTFFPTVSIYFVCVCYFGYHVLNF